MNHEPKVSVIMPSYNKEKYIGSAIESVLGQSYENYELLIIDDHSSDGSIDIVRQFHDSRIRLFQNQVNIGMAANRNKGIGLARGEYIALLDADDLSPAYRLLHEVEFLDQNANADVVYGGCQEIDENGVNGGLYISAYHNPAYIRALLVIKDIIPNGSCMYRKAFIDRRNIRYRENFCGMDDYMFWVECSVQGNIVGIPETLLYWRNFSDNTTNGILEDSEKARLRKEKYNQIHNSALKWNGFCLEERELQVFNRVFAEKKYCIANEEELKDFYHMIKKLLMQAESMDHVYEWQCMFKRQFGMALENSYLWMREK